MYKNLTFSIMMFLCSVLAAQNPQEQAAILKMAGTYTVSFDFTETYAPDSGYQFRPRYHAKAKEMVIVTENKPGRVSFSHFLLVNDTMVIKHWRQEWIYENRDFLDYRGANTWVKYSVDAKKVKGTWTQKVYQIDESPRYESYGKWQQVNNEWIWEAACNSPLPRRELLVRSDYSVLKRRSRIVIGDNYWYLEQDNSKIKGDTLLCYEKGMELFTKASYDTSRIVKWWNDHQKVWTIVMKEWDDILKNNSRIKLNGHLMTSDYQMGISRLIRDAKLKSADDKEIHKVVRKFILENCTL